jgi:DNA polymerase I-like protein with 3'-5' exonuclease and polymerase domains
VLGQNYGMSPYGIAAKTGRSLRWARGIHAQHRHAYPTFHRYLGDAVTQAKFDRKIYSVLGWPMAVTGDTKHRTLMNFIAQAAAADAMRLAGIAARDAGIRICCSVHDSFWILAPEGDEGRTIAKMVDIMREAGAAVSGGLPIEVEVKAVIPATHNLGDLRKPGDKGYEMWAEVHELLEGGLLRRAGGG